MKIVINKCYGGFEISNFALLELIKRNANCVSHYKIEDPFSPEFIYFKDDFYQHECLPLLCKEDSAYFVDSYDKNVRSDPDLISVVEEFGEKANGPSADLKVIEIFDDAKWYINEYDGLENIEIK